MGISEVRLFHLELVGFFVHIVEEAAERTI